MNKQIMLFTDGSLNPQSKIGYGAYLVVPAFSTTLESLKKRVKVKRFEDTSSAKLELQTLLWALKDIKLEGEKVIIYTDSQNILSLAGRRKRFEKNDYRSKNNKLIRNFKLYQDFYILIDPLDIELFKVSGHLVSNQKDDIDRFFTIVDRASRKAMREENR